MKRINFTRLFCALCVCVMTFFMCASCLRMFTRMVLVNRLGMRNAFTSMVFYDAQGLENARRTVPIDWETLYPFRDSAESGEEAPAGKWRYPAPLRAFSEKVLALEEKIHPYTTTYLAGYRIINEFANAYEELLQWNYVVWNEYNGVVKLDDGFLTSCYPSSDVSQEANATIAFAQSCRRRGADFLYIQTPEKICRYQDAAVSGSADFGNQNADRFLAFLDGVCARGVDKEGEQCIMQN